MCVGEPYTKVCIKYIYTVCGVINSSMAIVLLLSNNLYMTLRGLGMPHPLIHFLLSQR